MYAKQVKGVAEATFLFLCFVATLFFIASTLLRVVQKEL